MNDKHLAARAKLILRELHMRRATFLHAWMAEYVAECLETLEKNPTDTATKDRCAATIARLWQAYVEDRRQSLAEAGDVYRTRARLTDDVLAKLRADLSGHSSEVKGGAIESSVRLRHLMALEEQILEVYGTSAALSRGRDKQVATDKLTSDARVRELLAELRKETKTTAQRIVLAVFPHFGNVDLENMEEVGRAATLALRTIDQTRRQWLRDEESTRSKKGAAAEKPSSKKASRKPTTSSKRPPKTK